jgi:hypothetical protein
MNLLLTQSGITVGSADVRFWGKADMAGLKRNARSVSAASLNCMSSANNKLRTKEWKYFFANFFAG